MPDNTVFVGRPSRWGNPFRLDYFGDRAVALYADAMIGHWTPRHFTDDEPDWLVGDAYAAHMGFRFRIGSYPADAARYELGGKNLACWCPLDQPCHADVLLELANRAA